VDTHNSQSGDQQHRVRIDAAAATACGADSGGGGPRFCQGGVDACSTRWSSPRPRRCPQWDRRPARGAAGRVRVRRAASAPLRPPRPGRRQQLHRRPGFPRRRPPGRADRSGSVGHRALRLSRRRHRRLAPGPTRRADHRGPVGQSDPRCTGRRRTASGLRRGRGRSSSRPSPTGCRRPRSAQPRPSVSSSTTSSPHSERIARSWPTGTAARSGALRPPRPQPHPRWAHRNERNRIGA